MNDDQDIFDQKPGSEIIPIDRDTKIRVADLQIAFFPPAEINAKRFQEIMGMTFNKIDRANGYHVEPLMTIFSELPQPEPSQKEDEDGD